MSRTVALAVLAAGLVLASPTSEASAATKVPTRIAGWSTAAVTMAAGDDLSRRVTVHTGRRTPSRTVVVQHRAAGERGWQRLLTTSTGRRGVARLVLDIVPGSGWLRVKVPATRSARGAVSPRAAVTVTGEGWTPSAFEAEVLLLTNQIRAAGTTCGSKTYGPRPPLTANARLGKVSRRYARLMGEKDFFDHVSPAGDGPGDRVGAAGYDWSSYGENIAAGYGTPREVVDGWHESVGHCHNLMGSYTHLGVGHAEVDESRYGHYWVQLFAEPAR